MSQTTHLVYHVHRRAANKRRPVDPHCSGQFEKLARAERYAMLLRADVSSPYVRQVVIVSPARGVCDG